jgi:2-polyprenyl-6-methoxyphenol hydroxylase-like FAD-dependent oxidoreductase
VHTNWRVSTYADSVSYDVPLIVADMHGVIRMKHGEGEDTDRPEIDRRDLRVLLLNSVPGDKIRWGVKVERVQKQDDGTMSVCFVDGNTESGFRLVVGADGARSKARSLVSSPVPCLLPMFGWLLMVIQVTSTTAKYAGKYYITGNVSPESLFYSTIEDKVGTGNYMSMGGQRVMAAMRLGDRSYYTFAGLSLPESWKNDNATLLSDPEALRHKLVSDHFADWPKCNTDLIVRSDGGFYAWPLYGLAAKDVEWPTFPGVTLIGDAAHLW